MKFYRYIIKSFQKSAWLPALLLLLGCLPFRMHAQEFTASAAPNPVSVGQQVQVTFSVNANGKGFKAPSFPDFNILMGPSQSSQMQIINGNVSQTLSFTYVLEAIKEGTFKIGSAEITVGNKKILSNALQINVTKGAQKQGGSGQSADKGGTPGGKHVFIKARIDKSNVMIGEGISVIYRLYTRVPIVTNPSWKKLPSFTGFWSQDIAMPQQSEFHNENVDGVTYSVADIKKVILFPQRSGTLTIDPMEGEIIARVQVNRQQSNDPFGQMFNDPFFNNPFFNNVRDIKVELRSEPIKVNVKELPAGAPIGFMGAVGKFSYNVSLDKKETVTHDAVNLKIKISGKGNIKLIDAPKIEFPPDFETYDPKENVTANATTSGVTGTKIFEYLLIPRNPGKFKISINPFSYYDLEKKQYITEDATELTLDVKRGKDSETVVASGVNKSDVQILGKDIRFIKTSEPDLVSGHNLLFNSPAFYGLVSAPALLFAGLLLLRKRKEKIAGNVRLIKSQRANRIARKRLSSAKKHLSANEKEKFLDEMFRALWGFVSDKLQIPVSDLSKETAATALLAANVPDATISQFIETIDSCELARFGGGMSDDNEKLYQKGIEVISQLENLLG